MPKLPFYAILFFSIPLPGGAEEANFGRLYLAPPKSFSQHLHQEIYRQAVFVQARHICGLRPSDGEMGGIFTGSEPVASFERKGSDYRMSVKVGAKTLSTATSSIPGIPWDISAELENAQKAADILLAPICRPKPPPRRRPTSLNSLPGGGNVYAAFTRMNALAAEGTSVSSVALRRLTLEASLVARKTALIPSGASKLFAARALSYAMLLARRKGPSARAPLAFALVAAGRPADGMREATNVGDEDALVSLSKAWADRDPHLTRTVAPDDLAPFKELVLAEVDFDRLSRRRRLAKVAEKDPLDSWAWAGLTFAGDVPSGHEFGPNLLAWSLNGPAIAAAISGNPIPDDSPVESGETWDPDGFLTALSDLEGKGDDGDVPLAYRIILARDQAFFAAVARLSFLSRQLEDRRQASSEGVQLAPVLNGHDWDAIAPLGLKHYDAEALKSAARRRPVSAGVIDLADRAHGRFRALEPPFLSERDDVIGDQMFAAMMVDKNDIPEKIAASAQLIRLDPREPLAYEYGTLGTPPDLTALLHALETHPNDLALQRVASKIYSRAGRRERERLRPAMETLWRNAPGDPDAGWLRMLNLVAVGRLEDGFDALRHVRAANENSLIAVDATVQMARIRMRMGLKDEALRLAAEAAQSYKASALHFFGLLLEHLGDAEGAESVFKAIDERYNTLVGPAWMSIVFRARRQDPKSLKLLRSMSSGLNPQLVGAYDRWENPDPFFGAVSLGEWAQLDDAISRYSKGNVIKNAGTLCWWFTARRRMGMSKPEAIKPIRIAFQSAPTSGKFTPVVQAILGERKPDEAFLDLPIEMGFRDNGVFFLAELHAANGDMAAANAAYKRCRDAYLFENVHFFLADRELRKK